MHSPRTGKGTHNGPQLKAPYSSARVQSGHSSGKTGKSGKVRKNKRDLESQGKSKVGHGILLNNRDSTITPCLKTSPPEIVIP
jgi:hypothetical protein